MHGFEGMRMASNDTQFVPREHTTHHYSTSTSLGCWFKASWVRGFVLFGAKPCVPQHKSRLIWPGYVSPVFSWTVVISMSPLPVYLMYPFSPFKLPLIEAFLLAVLYGYICIYAFLGALTATWRPRFYKRGRHTIAAPTGFHWAVCCSNCCEGKNLRFYLYRSKIINASLSVSGFFFFFVRVCAHFFTRSLESVWCGE